VRDAVRERDASRINDAVVAIIEGDVQRMVNLRAGGLNTEGKKELDAVTEVVDWGVRTFGSYVGALEVCHSLPCLLLTWASQAGLTST
jgi:exportin-T